MNRAAKLRAGLTTRVREYEVEQSKGCNNQNGHKMHKPGSNKKGMFRKKKP